MAKHLAQSRKREIVEQILVLIEKESKYAPYTDVELAESLKTNPHRVRYYRHAYLDTGNAIERRMAYAEERKRHECGKQSEGATPKGKGGAAATKAGSTTKGKD